MKKLFYTMLLAVTTVSAISQIPDPCTGTGAAQPISTLSPCNCSEAQSGTSCSNTFYSSQSTADNAIHTYLTTQGNYAVPTGFQNVLADNIFLNGTYKHEFCTEYTTGPTTTTIAVINFIQVEQNCNAICQDYKIILKSGGTCGINLLTPTLITSTLDPTVKYRQYNVSPSTTYIICRQVYYDGNDIDCYLGWTGGDGVSVGAQVSSQKWFIWSLTALPVKLTNFTGVNYNNNNYLQWTAENEINFSKYEIEKSEDGISFKSISAISANTNSSLTQQYSYTDALVNNNAKSFYRLKQVDNNGKFTYSKIISISNKADKNFFTLFPNPATDKTDAKIYAAKSGAAKIEVLSASGTSINTKNILLQKGINSISIDVTDISKGVYFLRITNENKTAIQKFVKQ